MNHVTRVAVAKCRGQSGNVVCGELFGEATGLLKQLVHFALLAKLENQIDAIGVPKVAVQPQHIVVSEVALDFNLAAQLMLDIALGKLLLVQHLERADEGLRRALVAREVDAAEFSAAELLSEVEIVQRKIGRHGRVRHGRSRRIGRDGKRNGRLSNGRLCRCGGGAIFVGTIVFRVAVSSGRGERRRDGDL